MARLRYNGLVSSFGAALGTAETTVTFSAALTHSGGVAVPTVAAGDYIPLTILDANKAPKEIVYLTAYTAGATTGTIARAQEGTATAAHDQGRVIVCTPTTLDLTARDINAQTGTTYTLALKDAGSFVTMNNAAASTLTVPPDSAVAFPVGTFIEGAQLGAGQVTLTPGAGVTINAVPGPKIAARYGSFALLKTGANVWLAMGRLAA